MMVVSPYPLETLESHHANARKHEFPVPRNTYKQGASCSHIVGPYDATPHTQVFPFRRVFLQNAMLHQVSGCFPPWWRPRLELISVFSLTAVSKSTPREAAMYNASSKAMRIPS